MEVLIILGLIASLLLIIIEFRFLIKIPTHLDNIADELNSIKNILRERL